MKYNFYTVFDKGFLAKGLTLYDSVVRHCPKPFRFWIVCMDAETYDILAGMKLPSLFLLRLSDIEDDELRSVKATRSLREYCWGLKPSIATHIFTHYPDAETLMYLDGDLYFYSSIEPVYEEFGNNSVLIIPHHLPAGKKEKEKEVGIYNAGMLMFRNDARGRACLEWWRKECNAWCYAKPEPGKLGDQKYLDYFAEKFNGVYVLKNKAVDVAPWNIKNFRGKIKKASGGIMMDGEKLICFHFSSFTLYYPPSAFLPNNPNDAYGYSLPSIEKKLIYDEYADAVYSAIRRIHSVRPGFISGTTPRPKRLAQIKEMGIFFARKAVGR